MSFADYKVIDFFRNCKILFQNSQKYLYFPPLLPILHTLSLPLYASRSSHLPPHTTLGTELHYWILMSSFFDYNPMVGEKEHLISQKFGSA